MSKAPSQTQDKFIIRMPGDLRDRIKRAADRAGRSMNAEIVSVLEREYPPEKGEMTVRQLGDLLAWARAASGDELQWRLAELNAQLAGNGVDLRIELGTEGGSLSSSSETAVIMPFRR